MRKTKVMVAMSDPAVREWLHGLLIEAGRFEVVGTTDNGRVCVSMAARHGAELVILGLDLYEMDGLEVLRQLKKLSSPPKCLVLSQYLAVLTEEAPRAGADHCLVLPCKGGAVLRCADALSPSLTT